MRLRGLHHVELSVLDYDESVAFYDAMFGFLAYKSFWTCDIGYKSTYYVPNMFYPHSYVGIQPARTGDKLVPEAKATGIHHVALWAKSRREVDRFHSEFLVKRGIKVTEEPQPYDLYAPGYYAVFWDDERNGIHWELAHFPRIPSWGMIKRWRKAMRDGVSVAHPGWEVSPMKHAVRKLPKA